MAIKVKAIERNVAFDKNSEKWAYVTPTEPNTGDDPSTGSGQAGGDDTGGNGDDGGNGGGGMDEN